MPEARLLLRAAGAAVGDETLRAVASRSWFDPSRALVFTHIPKTAGTAVRYGLERSLGVPGLDVSGRRAGELTEDPTLHPLVYGHLAPTRTMAWAPGAQHITLLREGRVRLLSHWAYWRSIPSGYTSGFWGDTIQRVSRGAFRDMLLAPEVVTQVDNHSVRMLLGDHPLIPPTGRIDPRHDQELSAAAVAMLNRFSFVDVVENGQWVARLRAWLGRGFELPRLNETPRAEASARTDLSRHLTQETLDLVGFLTRLDNLVWSSVVAELMPGVSVRALSDASFISTVARHAMLLAPDPAS